MRSSGSFCSLFHLIYTAIPCRSHRINTNPLVIILTLFNFNLCCLSWSFTFIHTALHVLTLALHNRATLTDFQMRTSMNLSPTAATQTMAKRNTSSQGGGGWGNLLVLETVQQQGSCLGCSRTAPKMPYVSYVSHSHEGKHLECGWKGSDHLVGQP